MEIEEETRYNAGVAQYFVTAFTPREDTLGRYSKGIKADSMLAKAIAINDKFAPFHLYRAKTNSFMDFKGTKWLAAPHFEKYLAVVDIAKANKETLYDTYRYLAGYNSIVTKDMVKLQEIVDKAVAIKTDDPDKLKELLNPAPAVATPPTTGTVKTPTTPTPAVKPPKK
jgi:hypothetical protein